MRVVVLLLVVAFSGCWSGGHNREEVSVGLDFLGFDVVTVARVEHESAGVDALRVGARLGTRDDGLLLERPEREPGGL